MTETETAFEWNPPAEPLAVATAANLPPENLPQVVSSLDTATAADLTRLGGMQQEAQDKISAGTRFFRTADGQVICTDTPETEVWNEIIKGQRGYITVKPYSELHKAATRLSMIGLLAVESRGNGGPVTIRVHPDAVIEDLRENPADPYSERFVEGSPRNLSQIKKELWLRKYAIVDAATELKLPKVNGVDPSKHLLDAYAPYLKHYDGDPNAGRQRVTGLIAVSSAVDLVQSIAPVVPLPGREEEVFDFVDMLNDEALNDLCVKCWYLLPDHYKRDLPLRFSLNRFRTERDIANTAHTDKGLLNVILRLSQVSNSDGGWTYILKPKEGHRAREGVYEARALYACKLPNGKAALVADDEAGHTSKDATGEDPNSDTLVLAALRAAA